MSATSKGGAQRPSPLRALFALLRRRPEPARHEGTGDPPPPVPPPQAPVTPPQAAPESRPASPRQTSLLSPAANRRGDRTLFIEDFVEQFKQMMRRQGIVRSDPISPLMDMLCEMLIHYSNISQDLSNDLGATMTGLDQRFAAAMTGLDQRFAAAIGELRLTLAQAARPVERSMALASERLEALARTTVQHRAEVLKGFSRQTEQLVRTAVDNAVKWRTWRDTVVVGVLLIAAGAGGYLVGQSGERDLMLTTIQLGKDRFQANLLRDGAEVALHWMELMEENDLATVTPRCAPSSSSSDTRRVCSYDLIDDPLPDDAEPPSSKPTQ